MLQQKIVETKEKPEVEFLHYYPPKYWPLVIPIQYLVQHQ